ncbi:hypothetical protein KBTX_01688 [wastewater metagenome]|uniref:SF3 helicase domain-containing protein n=2 Tax=unclassified sequences TaxID=12908 RepID=A0A5B8RF94_9ZZZZ|nr:DNA primase family protein [Arhodomonas sp. KWT]QEA05367.1 hypothetical protein KBTEX_01688 [uncultured organism]
MAEDTSDSGRRHLDQLATEQGRSTEPVTAPTIDRTTPPTAVARLLTARHRLVRWQAVTYQYAGGGYRPLSDDATRALAYDFLERHGATARAREVSEVLDAVRAVALLSDELEPPVYMSTGEPPPRGAVVVTNGLLDLTTGTRTEATPDLFTVAALPVAHDPEAECPEWRAFLAALWPEDPEAVEALAEWFGYILSGETDQQKILMLVGPKRSGKGTILRVLTALLGRRNVASPTLGSLAGEFGLQPLIGKLAALVSDARLGGRADQEAIVERLLSISGEDHVSVPRKFLPDYTAQLQARVAIATNELPALHDESGAFASRITPLIMSRSWYGAEDHGLTDRLLVELPGILNWAAEGYRRLRERGRFRVPGSAAEAMQDLQDLGSPIGAFVRDECVVETGAEVQCRELYQEWCDWCGEHGRRQPGTEQSFGRHLKAAVAGVTVTQPRRNGRRVRMYQGIRLATAADHEVARESTYWHASGTRSETHRVPDSDRQNNGLQTGTRWNADSPTHAQGESRKSHNKVDRVPPRANSPRFCARCDGEGCPTCDGTGWA